MVKKLYTIDVENKELKTTATTATAKTAKAVEKKEVENFGIVEINNASAVKKVKNKVEKGFEKNVSAEAKKTTVKAKTSKVDDYFDFSFRKEEPKVEVKVEKKAEVKTEAKVEAKKTAKTAVKAEKKVASKKTQTTTTLKMSDEISEVKTEAIKFDSEADQIIRVARLGSLFDCDKRMINAY